jgi:hypothetical protein
MRAPKYCQLRLLLASRSHAHGAYVVVVCLSARPLIAAFLSQEIRFNVAFCRCAVQAAQAHELHAFNASANPTRYQSLLARYHPKLERVPAEELSQLCQYYGTTAPGAAAQQQAAVPVDASAARGSAAVTEAPSSRAADAALASAAATAQTVSNAEVATQSPRADSAAEHDESFQDQLQEQVDCLFDDGSDSSEDGGQPDNLQDVLSDDGHGTRTQLAGEEHAEPLLDHPDSHHEANARSPQLATHDSSQHRPSRCGMPVLGGPTSSNDGAPDCAIGSAEIQGGHDDCSAADPAVAAESDAQKAHASQDDSSDAQAGNTPSDDGPDAFDEFLRERKRSKRTQHAPPDKRMRVGARRSRHEPRGRNGQAHGSQAAQVGTSDHPGGSVQVPESEVRLKVQLFVGELLEPLLQRQVINLKQYTEVLGRAVEKILKVHGGAGSTDFLGSEAKKICRLVDKYVDFVRASSSA